MFQALILTAASAMTLLWLSSAVLAEFIPNPDFTQGDADKGKRVYQRVGDCVNCHGWAGDGQSGRNPLSHAAAANLRETKLDAQGLYDTIRCGIPGTAMPYHDSVSYRDDRCFGQVMADFAEGEQPMMGKTFREKQMVDLIAYLQKYMIGHGKPTYDECVLYYDTSADKACAYLKGK
jgi:mono/diheme cytochrome c family protein